MLHEISKCVYVYNLIFDLRLLLRTHLIIMVFINPFLLTLINPPPPTTPEKPNIILSPLIQGWLSCIHRVSELVCFYSTPLKQENLEYYSNSDSDQTLYPYKPLYVYVDEQYRECHKINTSKCIGPDEVLTSTR